MTQAAWRELAGLALAQFEVGVRRLRVLPLATNVLVRVYTLKAPLALRIATPGWRDVSDLEAEAMWLAALARDTPLAVPCPVGRPTNACSMLSNGATRAIVRGPRAISPRSVRPFHLAPELGRPPPSWASRRRRHQYP